ncbi:hypothetical protein QTP70_000159, partial [Hemibagrus guttatus]
MQRAGRSEGWRSCKPVINELRFPFTGGIKARRYRDTAAAKAAAAVAVVMVTHRSVAARDCGALLAASGNAPQLSTSLCLLCLLSRQIQCRQNKPSCTPHMSCCSCSRALECKLMVMMKPSDGFDYTVFVTTDSGMKCFNCGEAGHLVHACPEKVKTDGATDRQAEQTRPKVCSSDTEGDGLSVSGSPAAESVPTDPPAAKPTAAASSMLDPVVTVPPVVETGLSGGNPGATVAKPTGDKAGTSDPAKSDKEMSEPTSEPPVQISQVEELESNLDVDFKDNGGSDAEMEAEPVFKVPTKRKKKLKSKSNKQAKKHKSDVEESDGESTDSSWSKCSQSDEREIVHTAAEISAFLKNTKGKRSSSLAQKTSHGEQLLMEYYTQWEDGVWTEGGLFISLLASRRTSHLWRSAGFHEQDFSSLNKNIDLHKDCDTAAVGGTVRTGLCSLKRCSSTDGVKSVRVVAQLLQRWRSALTSEERLQLRDYCAGVVSPVDGEPSPVLVLVPNLSEVLGPLLGDRERTAMGLNTAS